MITFIFLILIPLIVLGFIVFIVRIIFRSLKGKPVIRILNGESEITPLEKDKIIKTNAFIRSINGLGDMKNTTFHQENLEGDPVDARPFYQELVKVLGSGFSYEKESYDTVYNLMLTSAFNLVTFGHTIIHEYNQKTTKSTLVRCAFKREKEKTAFSKDSYTYKNVLLTRIFPTTKIETVHAPLIIKRDARENNTTFRMTFGLMWGLVAIFIIKGDLQTVSYIQENMGIHWFIQSVILFIVVNFIIYFLYKASISKKAVTVENHYFEKIFDIYCEDEIFARQICDPLILEKMELRGRKSKGNREQFTLKEGLRTIKSKLSMYTGEMCNEFFKTGDYTESFVKSYALHIRDICSWHKEVFE